MSGILIAVLILIGAFFMFVAAFGVLRMPDLFMRLSTTAKASTLGASSLLLATAVYFNDYGITSRIVAHRHNNAGGGPHDRSGSLYQQGPALEGDHLR